MGTTTPKVRPEQGSSTPKNPKKRSTRANIDYVRGETDSEENVHEHEEADDEEHVDDEEAAGTEGGHRDKRVETLVTERKNGGKSRVTTSIRPELDESDDQIQSSVADSRKPIKSNKKQPDFQKASKECNDPKEEYYPTIAERRERRSSGKPKYHEVASDDDQIDGKPTAKHVGPRSSMVKNPNSSKFNRQEVGGQTSPVATRRDKERSNGKQTASREAVNKQDDAERELSIAKTRERRSLGSGAPRYKDLSDEEDPEMNEHQNADDTERNKDDYPLDTYALEERTTQFTSIDHNSLPPPSAPEDPLFVPTRTTSPVRSIMDPHPTHSTPTYLESFVRGNEPSLPNPLDFLIRPNSQVFEEDNDVEMKKNAQILKLLKKCTASYEAKFKEDKKCAKKADGSIPAPLKDSDLASFLELGVDLVDFCAKESRTKIAQRKSEGLPSVVADMGKYSKVAINILSFCSQESNADETKQTLLDQLGSRSRYHSKPITKPYPTQQEARLPGWDDFPEMLNLPATRENLARILVLRMLLTLKAMQDMEWNNAQQSVDNLTKVILDDSAPENGGWSKDVKKDTLKALEKLEKIIKETTVKNEKAADKVELAAMLKKFQKVLDGLKRAVFNDSEHGRLRNWPPYSLSNVHAAIDRLAKPHKTHSVQWLCSTFQNFISEFEVAVIEIGSASTEASSSPNLWDVLVAGLESTNTPGLALESRTSSLVETSNTRGTAVETPNARGTAVETSNARGTAVETSNARGTPVETSNMRGTPVETSNMRGTAIETSNMRATNGRDQPAENPTVRNSLETTQGSTPAKRSAEGDPKQPFRIRKKSWAPLQGGMPTGSSSDLPSSSTPYGSLTNDSHRSSSVEDTRPSNAHTERGRGEPARSALRIPSDSANVARLFAQTTGEEMREAKDKETRLAQAEETRRAEAEEARRNVDQRTNRNNRSRLPQSHDHHADKRQRRLSSPQRMDRGTDRGAETGRSRFSSGRDSYRPGNPVGYDGRRGGDPFGPGSWGRGDQVRYEDGRTSSGRGRSSYDRAFDEPRYFGEYGVRRGDNSFRPGSSGRGGQIRDGDKQSQAKSKKELDY